LTTPNIIVAIRRTHQLEAQLSNGTEGFFGDVSAIGRFYGGG